MGIKGSSTVQLYFQDAKVPVANVLGEIGKGHKIAFNILNIGRLKRRCCGIRRSQNDIQHCHQICHKTREQFRQPIAQFGAIKHKIVEMAIRIFSAESALYRTTKWIEDAEHKLLNEGKPYSDAMLGAAEEYAIECAVLKVYGSEMLDFVVDEGVQIHGGNGFSAQYNISRAYRERHHHRIL